MSDGETFTQRIPRIPPEGFIEQAGAGGTSHGNFEALIGPLYVKDITETTMRFGFHAEQKHCNYYGIVHGGVSMSVVDSMMGNLVFASVNREQRVSTISVTSDFLGAAKLGEWIEGETTLLRRGKSVAFTDARMQCDGRPIFVATGKWAIRH